MSVAAVEALEDLSAPSVEAGNSAELLEVLRELVRRQNLIIAAIDELNT